MRRATRRRLAIACGSIALGVSLAGCESAKDRFRHQLLGLRGSVEQERAQLAATLRTVRRHNRADVTLLNREIDSLAASVGAIARLKPPDGSVKQFAAYNAADAGLVSALRGFASALGSGTNQDLTNAANQAQDAAGAVTRTGDALDNTINPSSG